MAAITQPRSVTPWTGGRYGSFSAKFAAQTPDFMHGVLVAFAYLGGEIQASPHVGGTIIVREAVTMNGTLTAQPHVIGGIEAHPALQGRIEVNP